MSEQHPDERVQQVATMMKMMAHLFPEQTWWQEHGAEAFARLEQQGAKNVPTVSEIIGPIMEIHATIARKHHEMLRDTMRSVLETHLKGDTEGGE